MDRALFIAMSAAREVELLQRVNNHNLANVSTTGFKADFAALMPSPVKGSGYPARVYSQNVDIRAFDSRPGSLERTGRDLDVAIMGEGWFTIQSPDGGRALTRRGDFHITADGMLVTGDGDLVLGVDGPILVPPAQSLVIGEDGTVSIRPVGQPVNALAQVNRLNLVNPPVERLQKGEDGYIRFTGPPEELRPDASVRLVNGALERSNVNPVDAMVRLIEMQRSFEMQINMMKRIDDNGRKSQELMQSG